VTISESAVITAYCSFDAVSLAESNWDNIIRVTTSSYGWECLVPEVSRNHNFGEKGANLNLASYRRLISKMLWYQVTFGKLFGF